MSCMIHDPNKTMTINQAAKVIKTLDTPKQKQDVQTEKHFTSMASMYDVPNHSVLNSPHRRQNCKSQMVKDYSESLHHCVLKTVVYEGTLTRASSK